MDNTDEIKAALIKQQPLKARKMELGGDYYFKCYWLDCDADVKRYHDYCWKCGQRLEFE